MRIRGFGDSAQKAHIRAVGSFAEFLGSSPDTATAEDVRAAQLQMVNTNVTQSTYTMRLVGLRFIFETTCKRPALQDCLHCRTEPRTLPAAFSADEVFEILRVARGVAMGAALGVARGVGLTYRAALRICYGAGLRASEVCNLKVSDIISHRMLIHVEKGKGGKDRKVMLPPGLLDLLRDDWCEARPDGWLFPGKPKIMALSPRQLNRAFSAAKAPLGRLRRNRRPGTAWPGSTRQPRCKASATALQHTCLRPGRIRQATVWRNRVNCRFREGVRHPRTKIISSAWAKELGKRLGLAVLGLNEFDDTFVKQLIWLLMPSICLRLLVAFPECGTAVDHCQKD